MRTLSVLFLAANLVAAGNLSAADTDSYTIVKEQHITNIVDATTYEKPNLRKTAIIVENRAGEQFNDKVSVLEDMMSTRVAGKGYSVISRDVTVNALKNYSAAGVTVSSKSAGSDSLHVAATPDTTALDNALGDNTSALRLAQNLGADFILIPAITSYGTEKKTYNGNGISTVNVIYTLRVSYKIVEAGLGGAMRGGIVAATKTIRQTEGLQTEDSDLINELLDNAAVQLADEIAKSGKSLPTEIAKDKKVSFSVACTMTDPRQQPILISALGITADNHVVVTNQPIVVQALDVTVELDGVALGSAPGTFQAYPGLHKISLSREGFATWSRTINVYDGQTLRVALQMSNEGYAKWKDTTDFLATLDANRKLTDAEVNKINGIAEFFKNSHYRIDATNAPSVNIYKSLY